MPASDTALRQTLLEQVAHHCVQHGLTHAVISPGSRSAPLTAAFAANQNIQCQVVYDERSAGYIALGIAQQRGVPTVLICTSGTAALNYAPAVTEAFYQQVPLLILTADRPPEWIDQQDNQAIHQDRLYEPHLQASYSFPADIVHADARWHALRLLDEALARCTQPVPGPVHINVPLREPLYPAANEAAVASSWREADEGSRRQIQRLAARPGLAAESWESLLTQWQAARRKLVVAGLHRPDPSLQAALKALSQRGDVAVIADITANLFPMGTDLIHADALLGTQSETVLDALQPDLIISFGGPITSKYIKQFLRGAQSVAHWRVQPAGPAPDTYQNLTHVLPAEPASFFADLARRIPPAPSAAGYADAWRALEQETTESISHFLDAAPFGEFRACWQVMQRLPAGSVLQLGNSMPIRYANLLGPAPHATPGGVYGNRGVSGIDGAVSTAVGAAIASGRMTTLITGDLGFFYDRNGLWHSHLPANLRIVLLNNHGGGIFDIIDGPNRLPPALHQTYFLTPQPLTARRTAADHGLDYLHAGDNESLAAALSGFFQPGKRSAILEIETSMAVNTEVFNQFKRLVASIGAAMPAAT